MNSQRSNYSKRNLTPLLLLRPHLPLKQLPLLALASPTCPLTTVAASHMPSSDEIKALRVKEVTELIRAQHWSFNDFLIAFYSSSDSSIVTQRGRCLTKSDGARFAPEELVSLWLDHCPPSSRSSLEHVIIDHASRIVTKETDKACAVKSLCVSTTSVTDDDLDEGFLLSKLETEYRSTLPLLWLFLYMIITSPNRSEQQKQQPAASKETRAKFVECLLSCDLASRLSSTV